VTEKRTGCLSSPAGTVQGSVAEVVGSGKEDNRSRRYDGVSGHCGCEVTTLPATAGFCEELIAVVTGADVKNLGSTLDPLAAKVLSPS